jgi:hypothetical protein
MHNLELGQTKVAMDLPTAKGRRFLPKNIMPEERSNSRSTIYRPIPKPTFLDARHIGRAWDTNNMRLKSVTSLYVCLKSSTISKRLAYWRREQADRRRSDASFLTPRGNFRGVNRPWSEIYMGDIRQVGWFHEQFPEPNPRCLLQVKALPYWHHNLSPTTR